MFKETKTTDVKTQQASLKPAINIVNVDLAPRRSLYLKVRSSLIITATTFEGAGGV